MRGAEGIADEKAVAESGELFRKGLAVFFLMGREADIFEHQHLAVAHRLALAFGTGADTIECECHGIAEKLFKLFRDGLHGIFQVRAAFGTAEMRSENEAGAFLDGKADRWERFADAGVVGDHAVFERNVEVHADEDALAAKVEIADGELVHDSVTRNW